MQEQKSTEESSKVLQDKEKELQKALKDAKVPPLFTDLQMCLVSFLAAWDGLIQSRLVCSSCWHSKQHLQCSAWARWDVYQ